MIWIHCGEEREVGATQSLALRTHEHLTSGRVVVTAPADLVPQLEQQLPDLDVVSVPADTPTRVRAFLEDWAPLTLVWVGGPLRAVLLRYVADQKIPATLINARSINIMPRGTAWIPGASRNAVSAFEKVLTVDGATATRLTRGGVAREKVQAVGAILEEPLPLHHDQNERTVMVEAVGTRPIWFACNVVDSEIMHMAAAHLAASRKSHRLLLLLTPRDLKTGPQIATHLRETGLQVGLRSAGDDPLPEHQAYIADLPDELGLWFRIAPLTFMGGTMSGEGSLSPFDPILLGSAILHGTLKSPHEDRFTRLAKVEACREIRSAPELGIAIGTSISPEQSARMALAGWEEITRNADSINAIIKSCMNHVEAVS